MKLHDIKEEDYQLILLDLFMLVGMDKASDEKKERLSKEFATLVIQYFLTEKAMGNLTKKQMEDLLEKYPPESEENVNAMLGELGELLPDAPEMYVDSMVEVKARLVEDHYNTKKRGFQTLADETKDPDTKAKYQKQIEICDKKLGYIHTGEWALVLQ